MSKELPHRYQMWSHANQSGAGAEPAARPPGSGRSQRHSGDFGASACGAEIDAAPSLYHYGLPLEIELPGVCSLPSGRSTPCKTTKISNQSVDLVYSGGQRQGRLPEALPAGSPIDVDLERIGKFRGALDTQNAQGFRVAVAGDCRDMVSSRLAHVAAALRKGGLEDGSANAKARVIRLEPETKSCRFTDQLGTLRKGTIINVSIVDALIKAPVIPPVGALIVFSGTRRYAAEVMRVFEIGFAVRFCPPIPGEEFSAAIKFLDE